MQILVEIGAFHDPVFIHLDSAPLCDGWTDGIAVANMCSALQAMRPRCKNQPITARVKS